MNGQNSTGIEISDSNVKMRTVSSSNHRLAMNLKKESNVDFLGGNTHKDDRDIIKVTVATGEKASTINDDTQQYIQTSIGTGSQDVYYGFFETKEVNSIDDLKF